MTLAILAGCSSAAVCSGDVGPETLSVDASSYLDQPDVLDAEVCVVPDDWNRDEAVCSPPGAATISYTTPRNDYPAVVAYYVAVRTGESSFVYPEDGGGTQRLQCTATTTNILWGVLAGDEAEL
ncbi:MAG TPA: hypothetical protein VE569_10295 [Acidimicrobiia bacterium]|jgi:hypothetical protein|nr:hypothetical protein [Acidimicrobiia bacterium]